MKPLHRRLRLSLICFAVTLQTKVLEGVSLSQLVCSKRPELCKNTNGHANTNHRMPDELRTRPTDFRYWQDYGKAAPDGTGYGPGVGPGYGPGLGDVAVRTGVGVNYPFGGLAVRRDFEVGFGGSGSIGGRTFGFGDGFGGNPWDGVNGYPRDYPLMNWHSSYGPGGWMIG